MTLAGGESRALWSKGGSLSSMGLTVIPSPPAPSSQSLALTPDTWHLALLCDFTKAQPCIK